MTEHRTLFSLILYFLPCLEGVRGRWAQAALLLALPSIFGAGLLWAVKLLIDEVFVAQQFEHLPILLTLYLFIGGGKAISSYLASRLDTAVMERIALRIRVRLYGHILRLSPGSLTRHNNGDLLTRLSGDVERVEYLIYSGPLALFADVFAAALFICSLLVLSWKLTLCALLVAPFFLLISLTWAGRIRRTARVARRQTARWTDIAEERLNAMPMIQAAGAERFETLAFERRCESALKSEVNVTKVQALSAVLIDGVAVVGGLAILAFGALCIRNGELTAGALIAFLGALGSLYGPIRSIAKAPGRFQQAAARAQRVRDILDAPSLVVQKPTALSLQRPHGSLEFDNVTFGYSPSQNVLDGICLKIEPGETVAIVGPSGSGKSTLIKLALRLYDPSLGSVRIDGNDLRDLTIRSAREAVSAVWQEPHLFSGSIAENICYDRTGIHTTEMTDAGRAACLSEFVERLRGRYDAPVGPGGRWLSGGQRQRVILARALLRKGPILLFDEATSAVDSETEEQIQAAIDNLSGHRTMLIVAHRLSSIRRAHRIVVLENGRIVETGSPATLLRRDSRCRSLFAGQIETEGLAA
jgi:ABC-type multidrug transport system fused ATPase/permease subunit